MNAKRIIFSLGAALVTSKLAKAISQIDADSVLGTVGLSRRRSHLLENVGVFAVGALAGAGAALLFAPTSGSETRAKIGRKAEELGEAASKAIREAREELPHLAFARDRNGAHEQHSDHQS
jgi:hypothetical protein